MMTKKILFPTDFSSASNAALRYAVSLARESEALLLVVHVAPPSVPAHGTVAPPADDLAEEEKDLLTILSDVFGTTKSRLRTEFRTIHGDPATEIVRLAQAERVDQIVMATAGRTGVRRLLMGSVAEAVAATAPCPLLALREPYDAGAAEALPAQGTHSDGRTIEFREVARFDPRTVNGTGLLRSAIEFAGHGRTYRPVWHWSGSSLPN